MLSHRKVLLTLLIAGLLISGCTAPLGSSSSPTPVSPIATDTLLSPPASEPTNQAGLANPASAYCEQQGGRLEIRTDSSAGQYGVCIFQDGSECDEWMYFRGECQPGSSATAVSTAEPLTNTYVNDDYGFSIATPNSWVIEEYPDYLNISRPEYRLFIGFQAAIEEPKPFRTGMPEGDFIDGGSATLLGQPIPKQILVFDGKNKVVSYGGRIKAGDLILVMYLDGIETSEVNYRDIDIPPEIIAEADQIISSIALKSGEQPTLEFNPQN